MTTKYEFRDILPEELDQVIQIEQICFPPNEACSAKSMTSGKCTRDIYGCSG